MLLVTTGRAARKYYTVGDDLTHLADREGCEAVIRLATFLYRLLPEDVRARAIAPWLPPERPVSVLSNKRMKLTMDLPSKK
jgi:hypothetical protein